MSGQGGAGLGHDPGRPEHPPVVEGYVSRSQPAPAAFGDPLWVIIPAYSPDSPYLCAGWVECHGNTLPAQGARVVVTFGTEGVPTAVWWEGAHSESAVLEAKIAALEAAVADTGWIEATLENGYTNLGAAYGTVAYRKIGHVVYFKGGVSLSGRTTGTRVFQLPSEFHPKYQQFPALGEEINTANKAECFVLTNGEVLLGFAKAENDVVFTGMPFPVN